MNMLQYLKYFAGIVSIITGIVSLFWPLAVRGFTGLEVSSGRGVTEIRSILGGVFIGLGVAVLYLNVAPAYQVLGITYLTVGIVRAISMFVDKSVVGSNIISLIVEFIFGILLVL